MTEPKATIVLLNGADSAGKSSIARALQGLAAAPFLHLQMDAFLDMLPARLDGTTEGVSFEPVAVDGHPALAVRIGPAAARMLAGMRAAVAAMAAAGNNLIVDDVLLDGEGAEYDRLLAGFEFRCVGVFARLEVLEARERLRGDRLAGLARWQFDRVHRGMAYDLWLDASDATPEDCARRIVATFGL